MSLATLDLVLEAELNIPEELALHHLSKEGGVYLLGGGAEMSQEAADQGKVLALEGYLVMGAHGVGERQGKEDGNGVQKEPLDLEVEGGVLCKEGFGKGVCQRREWED